MDGPLGSRVFALAVSPRDGGVWGATEAGLFRYVNSHWTYFTRAEGLPSDQANALAFGADGTLYVGTPCDGIAVGSPDNNYKTWRTAPGPTSLPNSASGRGLPSALINCLLVSSDNTVFAGTTTGLAKSRDGGETWTFVRGLDWKAKLAGLSHPIAPAPSTYMGDLLTEDYVTSLAEDGQGRLFVGHRQTGVEAFDGVTGKRLQSGASGAKTDAYAFCLLVSGHSAWVGQYGGGLLPPADLTAEAAPSPSQVASLPVPAAPPTLAELNRMLKAVRAVPPDPRELEPKVVALADDWRTQGDWVGRYGRYWAYLYATNSPQSYIWGAGQIPIKHRTQMGPNPHPNDALRYWIERPFTNNPRSLELPPVYLNSRLRSGRTTPQNNRREAEVDDHGESTSMKLNKSHICCTLLVPQGLFFLSLYEFNKDGHDANNRFRDYRISIRAHTGKSINDLSGFNAQPELAHGRIRDFWGGVWKRFLVRGPLALTVELDRNNSFNTILPAIMLDLTDEYPEPYFRMAPEWDNKQTQKATNQQTRHQRASTRPANTTKAAVGNKLYEALERTRTIKPAWWAANRKKFYSALVSFYLAQTKEPLVVSHNLSLARMASCYYQLGMYPQWEHQQKLSGISTARQIEQSLQWNGKWEDYAEAGTGEGRSSVVAYLADRKKLDK